MLGKLTEAQRGLIEDKFKWKVRGSSASRCFELVYHTHVRHAALPEARPSLHDCSLHSCLSVCRIAFSVALHPYLSLSLPLSLSLLPLSLNPLSGSRDGEAW